MENKITLRTPILINGVSRKEFTYDFNEISCEEFSAAVTNAQAKSFESAQKGKACAAVMEQDTNLHMYLGMAAIIAVNPDVDITDLERMKGFDVVMLAGIGRNFIVGRSEEPSSQSSLEEQSEVTPGCSTQESEM